MSNYNGNHNEDNFVFELHGKRIGELNNNLKFFIQYLFPHTHDDDLIECYKTEDYIKPDIYIKCKDREAFVSLKCGISDCVHGESLTSFIDFLRLHGIEERVIRTIKLFTYGDGTEDGSGTVRKNGLDIRYELKEEIEYLNFKLNESKDFVKKVVNRLLLEGVNPLAYKAQYIYHGTTEYGDFVSKNQVLKHIDIKNWDFMDCPHIGPIVFRPHARYANKKILHDKFRSELKFTWPNFLPDIRYIAKRFNF